jgi:striatin 1/3/4
MIGVMRFLQTEWHRHERDRNAWEIERAEMRSRIGKLEGDGRTSKRLQETLGKHVKMLESALRREREKLKAVQAGEAAGNSQSTLASDNENLKSGLKRMESIFHLTVNWLTGFSQLNSSNLTTCFWTSRAMI